jgi:GNAT superfamily N-acetyltransferase
LKALAGEREEMNALQKILESAEDYYNALTGYPPGQAESTTFFMGLPDGVDYHQKYVFGIYKNQVMVGCIELLRGYPDPKCVALGSLVIDKKYQKKRLGRLAFRTLLETIQDWADIKELQTDMPLTLSAVFGVFEKLGFRPTGKTTLYEYSYLTSESVYFRLSLENDEHQI